MAGVAARGQLPDLQFQLVPVQADQAHPALQLLGPSLLQRLNRAFDARLAEEWQRAVRNKTALSLVVKLSKQSGVKIVVDDKVPAYKLDAFLINTSLRYALGKVTKAAGLEWKLPPNHTVLITTN